MTLTPAQSRLDELLDTGNTATLGDKESLLLSILESNEPEDVKDLAEHQLKHVRIFIEEEELQKAIKERANEISVPIADLPLSEVQRVHDDFKKRKKTT